MLSYPHAHIDLAALRHNFTRVKQCAPSSKVMSVIKANAYGHGAVEAAKALTESDAFAVARLSEGVSLREAGIEKPIVLLEGIHTAEECVLAGQWRLSPVFHNRTQMRYLEACEQPLSFCWVMVETGMHRLGFKPNEVGDALEVLKNSGKVEGEIGLMTHFANADSENDVRNQQQFEQLMSLPLSQQHPVSMANSAAVITLAESHQQWLRPGIMLYGASPFDDKSAEELGLKPVMTVKAQVIAIDDLKKGDQVGYGGEWQADKPMRVGTVNMGYGDGYKRLLSNCGQVYIRGQLVPVLGRVSMDMICIDLSSVQEAEMGDEVELWGNNVPVNEVAKSAQTISYELLCQLSPRVVRHYHG